MAHLRGLHFRRPSINTLLTHFETTGTEMQARLETEGWGIKMMKAPSAADAEILWDRDRGKKGNSVLATRPVCMIHKFNVLVTEPLRICLTVLSAPSTSLHSRVQREAGGHAKGEEVSMRSRA